MAAEDTTVMEDWTGGTGDPEKCAHSKCTRPKDMAINWVQCDKCDKVRTAFYVNEQMHSSSMKSYQIDFVAFHNAKTIFGGHSVWNIF
jgi:hypothetical protein